MTPTAHTELEERVRREAVRLMLDRTRSSNLATAPGATLICWLLWTYIDHYGLLLWLAAKIAVAAARLAIDHRARRDDPGRMRRWGARYEMALALDGFLFGMLGWALLPTQIPLMGATMAATLVGIAAIGLVVLSASWRACMAFTLPVMLPGLSYQLMQGDHISTYLGLGMALFTVLLVVEVRRAADHTLNMLRVGMQMNELARERQAALEQAQRSDAAKGQFLATMSHEMRTPLHGMLGLARELQRPGVGAAQVAAQLGTLERAGDHLLGIINDVLDYSKIDGGYLRLVEQDFELNALLANLHTLFMLPAEERGLQLKLHRELPEPCWLRGDAARLRQILLNLLGNAIKFTEAGEVRLQASCLGTAPSLALCIEVADSGPGVPAPERERIFEAFHQLDGSYARRKGGTGLGLTISRELARAMGGDLACVHADAPGALFRLNLQLPLGRAPAAAETAHQAFDRQGLQARVLLVEDNEVNAIVARAMLERAGAEVTHAATGELAVELAEQRRHDIILMDCQMPGIDGFEATARIRQRERERRQRAVPIVALTANALEGDRQRCLKAGMDDHLSKPFREDELLGLVRARVEARA